MRWEYDFSNARNNLYAKEQQQQITINVSKEVIEYFEMQAQIYGIPYQTLISLYLSDCAKLKRGLPINRE